ncbi:MAG: NYN domain-containing protein, partial [Chloroflexi bacterium]|nr:NYN domain-containing protein [Chloroflexota bacterium]
EAPPPAENAEAVGGESDAPAEQAKSRRRRPRAPKAEATATAETPDAGDDASKDDAPATQPATRRRRSRATAAQTPETPETTETAGTEGAAATANDAPAEQAKPRRSRSRAAAAEKAETPDAGAAAQSPPAAPSSTTRRRTGDALAAVEKRLERLEQLGVEIASQRGAITRLGESVDELAARLDRAARKPRLGVFVDVPNVLYGVEAGEPPIDMGKLLAMLSDGRELVRATAYAPVSDDPREAVEQQKFVAPFVPHAYRIVTKPLKRFADGSVKGNFDVEMAIDLVTMSERLDVVAVVSGDSDFARAVEMVQSRGVRVEVVAFAGSTSVEMRALADHYVELGRFAPQLR